MEERVNQMNVECMKKIFKDRKCNMIGEYKKFAVMILIKKENSQLKIVFEERSHNMRRQPGDICLPGGSVEHGETPMEAAVRETAEELDLKVEDIEVIGEMDYFVSPYNFIIYPFIAVSKSDKFNPSPDETESVFSVPVKFFMNEEPLAYDLEIGPHLKGDFPFHLIRGGKNYKFGRGFLREYFYKYDDYVIWGSTAQIIKSFTDIIKNSVHVSNL